MTSRCGALRRVLATCVMVIGTTPGGAALAERAAQTATGASQASTPRQPLPPQTRPHSVRVAVDPARVVVDDGDTVVVTWPGGDTETVRILGIDCPETRHPEHDLPYGQQFGEEARAFGVGVFATATKVELLRAATMDPYKRTLGYFFVDGANYSVSVIRARLAEESITAFGDNGFPDEAKTVRQAAADAGPLPFEPPFRFRARMREVAKWMKSRGSYPPQ